MKNSILIITILFAGVLGCYSQSLTYDIFMDNVRNKNIEYIVEKYNVDIAKAKIEAAKIFPDPELSFSGTDNQERSLKMGYSLDAGLGYTIELGGKRKARIRLAQSETELSSALLQDFFRNLRAEATLTYMNALYQKQLYEVQRQSYMRMAELARADSIRFSLGSIMEVDAMQSKLEANTMLNDLIQSETDLNNVILQLMLYQGDDRISKVDSIEGELTYFKRKFDLDSLIILAQDSRSDLLVALKSKEVSQYNLKLAKANRSIDLGLNIGVSYNAEVRNEIAPAPAFTAVTAGISIPLKFSNTNKGEIRAGKLAVEQSEASYHSVERRIRMEVIQAYNLYTTACRQVELFNTGHLDDARKILRNKTYSYERGETSMLEVINAQRTYNDVLDSYYKTLYNCVSTLIELERSVGVSLLSRLPENFLLLL
ncbi:transporter [Bacteroidia bacterium]|nr:transporter [Bacteroidia bacterium]